MENEKSSTGPGFSFGHISLAEKALFAKHLSIMLKAGMSISEALETIYTQTDGYFRTIIGKLVDSVRSGNSFSGSLKRYSRIFPRLLINTVAAGESSGNLENNLEIISRQLQKDMELRSKIRGAMAYPIMVLSLAVGLGLFISFFILPKITPLFEGLKIKLPLSTRLLIGFSSFIQHYGIVFLVAAAISAIALAWLAKTSFAKPFTDHISIHFPIFGKLVRNSNLAVFCRTLGTLLKSGMNIDEALNLTKETVSNYYYAKSLGSISEEIIKGGRLSENLEKYGKLYPKMTTNMIRIGEKSGNLEESLFYLEEFYESEVDSSIKSMATIIEPVLLIFIGIAVGGLAVSIITPIYTITGSIH